MKKILFSVLSAFLICSQLHSNTPETEEITFSADTEKHPLVGLGGMMIFNVGLAGYNRFAVGSAWAKTGPDDWIHFYERRLSWDNDWYWTNFFLHPYQGSMYYMSARGANLNTLESMGVTVLGSAIWEYFCEQNSPSINDMAYTTIGSFCVGEMFFRLSQEANSKNIILGTALNPERLWTEYICRVKQKNTHGNIHSMSLALGAGTSAGGAFIEDFEIENYENNFASYELYPVSAGFEFAADYNDPYGHDSNSPYSQFTLNVQGGMGKGSGKSGYCAYEDIDRQLFYDIRIFSDAMLFSRAVNTGSDTDSSLGMTMIYDFEWHSYYMLSSLAPGIAFKQRINRDAGRIEWQSQLALILLGTTDYYYFHRKVIDKPRGIFRNYNDTVGIESIGRIKYSTDSGHVLALDFRGYIMHDFYHQLIKFRDMTQGWEFIGLLGASYEFPVTETFKIGLRDEVYAKYALYKSQNDLYQILNTAKLYVKIQFK